MNIGTLYRAEWSTYTDAQTGRRVTQLTNSPAEDYHLYFYNPTVTHDNRHLVFISERTGISNLFRLDLDSGEIVQLSDAAPARADYYPFTYKPVSGVGACLSAIGAAEVFYFVGTELFGVNPDTLQTRKLLQLPADRRPSILHADAAGTTLVFATWDEKLFGDYAEQLYAGKGFPNEAEYQKTTSTIHRLDTMTGQCDEILRMDNFWINHVLIHPTNLDLVLFCHEYSRLCRHDAYKYDDDQRCHPHPSFTGDGARVIFTSNRTGTSNVYLTDW